ncbi:DUF4097 family beta strand repeat-containing protein [Paucisalibacillus globulus]|uniref:DUF4097 family beta strand repeat-containing protein n=1 Tax=Paucisalibacillus globulus TaxID=351095 RepID=UPI00042978CC|nr:DUF4097 family beta strand repeat-containing protein [Paucisalibacillus globulus]
MKIEKTVESVVNRFIKSAKSSIVKQEVIQKERIDSTSIHSIHISTTNLDIEVTSHKEQHIDIVLKTYEDGPQLEIDQENDSLKITAFQSDQIQTFFGVYPSTKVQVLVPSAVVEEWDVRTGSGDVSFSEITMSMLSVNSGSGDIKLSTIDANQVKLRSSSGDIKAKNLKAEACQIGTSSGDMVLQRLTVINLQAKASSGDIAITNIQGENLEIQTASGSVELKDIYMVTGSIVSSSGDVDANHVRIGKLLGSTKSGSIDMKDFTGSIKGLVVSGDLKLQLRGECAANLDAKSGDIIVELENEIGLNATVDIISKSEDITTNLPLECKDDSSRLFGVIGAGENAIRITSLTGDVKVYKEEVANY